MSYAEIIARHLDETPKSRQQLAEETGIEAAQVSAALSVMRSRGLAARNDDGWTLPGVEPKPNGHALDATWPASSAAPEQADAPEPSREADASCKIDWSAPRSPLNPAPEPEPQPDGYAASVLAEAQAIVYGDREMTHGAPARNLEAIARIWTALLAGRLAPGATVTPDVVCLMMAGLKLARAANKPSHRDHARDVCGYMALMERCGFLDATG